MPKATPLGIAHGVSEGGDPFVVLLMPDRKLTLWAAQADDVGRQLIGQAEAARFDAAVRRYLARTGHSAAECNQIVTGLYEDIVRGST